MISLANRYRPSRIADLLGQEVLRSSMTAAITENRVASALILSGIRGTGKTSTARIIARAVNCKEGPTINPCGKCANCKEIEAGISLDVIEMDAGSNNGVDNIRRLQEEAETGPVRSARKIYILDEAHMLTPQAWNALLKILEDAHAKDLMFILATTELDRILDTVKSRCQAFTLRRIDETIIENHLHDIAKQERVRIHKAALQLISQAAEGSMRDALSILDQAISGSGNEVIEKSHVEKMLGRTDRIELIHLLYYTLGGNVVKLITHYHRLIEAGADPIHLLDALAWELHLVRLAKADAELLGRHGTTGAIANAIKKAAAQAPVARVSSCLNLLCEARGATAQNPAPRQAVEMLLLRLAHDVKRPAQGVT
jgi:DNA polymerase-3 subunit gamma/tau